ncbi:hypothetical protein [Chryseobacterium sp. CFS15]|uniref:hypothetical protein n=1 Tax=Chryseobacterium sp. CFS15 TaxID=2986946 RepID=UPI0028085175|nr:hypothetical protein [Chryseobacterium sp. CFS15]MDQ8140508.1 hypothetical protein [Chryseobacterium sp. CFS15]
MIFFQLQFSRTSDTGRNRGNAGAALADVNFVRASRTARPSVKLYLQSILIYFIAKEVLNFTGNIREEQT